MNIIDQRRLIDQLMNNEKPFGLMSEEMQKKAKEILEQKGMDFLYFSCNKDWPIATTPTFEGKGEEITYCLRPDYEDEPEIVECEIYGEKRRLVYKKTDMSHGIDMALRDPDFIGFKFEDETKTISCMPVLYQMPGQTYPFYGIKSDDLHESTVLHASHVLFRRKKKE